MGLFNWKKKKQEEPPKKVVGSFVSFVLLGGETYDFHRLTAQLKEDWDIDIKDSDVDFDNGTIAVEVEGMMVAISLMGAPVPDGEAVVNARTNYAWEDAVSVAEHHQAHILAAVLPRDSDVLDAGLLSVKLLSSIARDEQVTGINTLGSVLHPGAYREIAELALGREAYPVMNLVFVGLYSNDGGKTTCGYTFGLESFGKEDMEVIDSEHSREEIYYFLYDIADYVITGDVELQDGETIGFSEDQKLQIIYSEGKALPGKTLKLDF